MSFSKPDPDPQFQDMTEARRQRYSRHSLLDEIGVEGQARIAAAHVLLVGVGGLGSPASLYLASAGVGHITLADGDTVDLSNLQRQVLHTQARIGQWKAVSGKAALVQINPEIVIETVTERLSAQRLAEAVARADIILACCDNFATRHELNQLCLTLRKPLVNGAVNGFGGQLSVFDFRREDSPCYHCLFPEGEGEGEEPLSPGVFAPLVGMIGTMQAAETLKLILGIGQPLTGRLLLLDALRMEWRNVRFGKDPGCAVCALR